MKKNYVKIIISIFVNFYAYMNAMENKSAIILADEHYIKHTCMHWTDKSLVAIEPLQGGRGGSRLYAVNFEQGEPCVVRLLVSPSAREKAWQEAEISAMKSADEAQVGPHIFAAYIKDDGCEIGYVVMQKINSIAPQEISWNNAITYTQLGELLKKMHAQPSVIPVDEEALYRRAGILIDDLKKKWQVLGIEGFQKKIEKIKTLFDESKTKLIPHGRTHLMHGDLIGRNLLHDGLRFWAIDWENSRVTANPLFDIALVQDCFVPNEYHTDFMRGYCGQDELPYDQQKTFPIVRILANCYVGMAYARIKPQEFVDLFTLYKKSKIDVVRALHSLIHEGYIGDDKDVATYGTLFFMQGYALLKKI